MRFSGFEAAVPPQGGAAPKRAVFLILKMPRPCRAKRPCGGFPGKGSLKLIPLQSLIYTPGARILTDARPRRFCPASAAAYILRQPRRLFYFLPRRRFAFSVSRGGFFTFCLGGGLHTPSAAAAFLLSASAANFDLFPAAVTAAVYFLLFLSLGSMPSQA